MDVVDTLPVGLEAELVLGAVEVDEDAVEGGTDVELDEPLVGDGLGKLIGEERGGPVVIGGLGSVIDPLGLPGGRGRGIVGTGGNSVVLDGLPPVGEENGGGIEVIASLLHPISTIFSPMSLVSASHVELKHASARSRKEVVLQAQVQLPPPPQPTSLKLLFKHDWTHGGVVGGGCPCTNPIPMSNVHPTTHLRVVV